MAVMRRSLIWNAAFGLSATVSGGHLLANASDLPNRQIDELEQAAHGHLDNVFLVSSFAGYVAFPRSAVVENISGPGTLIIDVAVDGYARGWARLGSFSAGKDGRRVDIIHHYPLPNGPTRTESRGRLVIEYFGSTSEGSVVLVHDASDYVVLVGSASLLTNAFVEASVALSGPPDILAPGWKPLRSWSSLPSWGASARREK